MSLFILKVCLKATVISPTSQNQLSQQRVNIKMACSKEDQKAMFIGNYLWDKVGSKNNFKTLKNTSTVVTCPSKHGLTQDVVGVFTTIGEMAFFVDIHTLMTLPSYSFGKGVPTKVHMSVPLRVPMLVQQALAKRMNNKGEDGKIGMVKDEDMSSQIALATTDRKIPSVDNTKCQQQLSLVVPEHTDLPVGDMPPPTPAPETAHLTAAHIFNPQDVPMVNAQPKPQPAQKRGRQTTSPAHPKKPRRTQKLADPLEVAAYEETIEQVASGMLPTDNPVVQAAATAGITTIINYP